MTVEDFMDKLRDQMQLALSEKTGWGRNAVMIAFDKACITVLTQALSAQDKA